MENRMLCQTFMRTFDDIDDMRILNKKSVFGNYKVMQEAKEAFDNMDCDRRLNLYFRNGEPVAFDID